MKTPTTANDVTNSDASAGEVAVDTSKPLPPASAADHSPADADTPAARLAAIHAEGERQRAVSTRFDGARYRRKNDA